MSQYGGDSPAPTQINMMYPRAKKNKEESLIFTLFCWLFTLLIWILIILLIFINKSDSSSTIQDFYNNFNNYNIKKRLKLVYSVMLCLVYIIYLILEISSPLLKYLYNKETKIVLIEKMKTIFKKIPSLELVSDNHIFKFKIISSRDISGTLIYNNENKHKKYILLKLKQDIIFGDDFTSFDYITQKENFIKELKEERGHCKIKEVIKIRGVEKYNMLKLNNSNSIIANHICYIIFAFLTLSELYKFYINYICIYGEYTIRKVISSLNDLSQSSEYNKYNPKINSMLIDSRIYNNININYNSDRRKSFDNNKRFRDEKKYFKIRTESTRIVNEEK